MEGCIERVVEKDERKNLLLYSNILLERCVKLTLYLAGN
jgi:hypothetical protein